MSSLRLNDRVQVLAADDMPENEQGNPVPDWDNAPTIWEPAFITTRATTENNVSQDQVTTTRLAILLPTTTAKTDSRVLWHGVEFEVDGDVQPVPDLRGRIHHCEATLRRVSG